MSLLGSPKKKEIIKAWENSMIDILEVNSKKDIPELNIYQCGSYKMHSLKDAKMVAERVLERGISKMKNSQLKLDMSLLERDI